MLVALFGITNEGLNLFVNLVLLFLVVVWIALIAWTFLDARRRIQDPVLVACATGASLFPYVGTVVYSILRPPEFLEDARERQLEIRAAELRVRQLEEQSCPSCGHPIERTYLRCPNCRARVKDPCESCEKPIDPRWTVCPYCETPQRRAAPQPRRERASEGEVTEKRAARPKRARPEARRQPASQSRSGQPRQARSASRQASTASKRKPAPGRSGSGAPPTREGPGEDRPRPATAS
jgi:Double zinc ribbon